MRKKEEKSDKTKDIKPLSDDSIVISYSRRRPFNNMINVLFTDRM